jgi:nitrogen fixation/metabolism regulation signal transduction histidine kinase
VVFGLIKQVLANPFNGMKANLMTFWNQNGPMVLALACLMPIFIRDTLTLSNRIAGPIHNLRNKCRELADGVHDVAPLKFRKHDMWDDLPELFNRMMQQVNKGEASLSTSAVVTETEKLPESVGV